MKNGSIETLWKKNWKEKKNYDDCSLSYIGAAVAQDGESVFH